MESASKDITLPISTPERTSDASYHTCVEDVSSEELAGLLEQEPVELKDANASALELGTLRDEKASKHDIDGLREELKNHVENCHNLESLPEDTFSLLCMTQWRVTNFWVLVYALGTFVFQITILSMCLLYVLRYGSKSNWLDVPGDVETSVRVAQPIALVIAVWMEEDMLVTLALFKDRAHETLKTASGKEEDKPHWFWFGFANYLRFLESLFTLVISFILIVQSKEVLQLFLNFAAVHFVSQLDNLSFSVAVRGFICLPGLEKESKSTSKARYKVPKDEDPTKLFITQAVKFTIIASLFIGWLFVTIQQQNSFFITKRVLVEFIEVGEDNRFDYGNSTYMAELFDGVYVASKKKNVLRETLRSWGKNPRVAFCEEKWSASLGRPQGVFAYCQETQRWAFGLVNETEECNANRKRDCKFGVYSSKILSSDGFQLTDAILSSWSFADIKLREVNCNPDDNVGEDGPNRMCSNKGHCTSDEKGEYLCKCDKTRGGMFCEFDKPKCNSLTTPIELGNRYDFADTPTPIENRRILSKTNSTVHTEYPIYLDEKNHGDLIIYLGTRWVFSNFLTHIQDTYGEITGEHLKANKLELEEPWNTTNMTDFQGNRTAFLEHIASALDHTHWSQYTFCADCDIFVSERTKKLSPKGLSWERWLASSNNVSGVVQPFLVRFGGVDAKFQCNQCNAKTDICSNGSNCNQTTGECKCKEAKYAKSFTGILCDIPCREAKYLTCPDHCQ